MPKVKDKRVLMVPIGCGHCIECRKQKANEWKVRLNEELKTDRKAFFVTLTFNEEKLKKHQELYAEKNEGLEGNENDIATLAIRMFLERWRKNNGKAPRHWLITERGHNGTERIHLHGIIWWESMQDLEKTWKNGFVFVGNYVNERTINYIVKYVTKVDNDHKDFEGKILASAGIGGNYMRREKYLNMYKAQSTYDFYKLQNGRAVQLPIYYRNHIYTDEQREKLWLEKLDKKKIYVRGVEYDISTPDGIEKYMNGLKVAQNDNEKNGYGGIKWKKNEYADIFKKLNDKWLPQN